MITLMTHSPEETEALAAKIGARLRGGEMLELISDLGGGKTTFVRGLARGAGSEEHVASPTFTLDRVYRASGFTIRHIDLYRLTDAGILQHDINEMRRDQTTVLVVEWGGVVRHVLPKERVTIRLSPVGENERKVEITCAGRLKYLAEDLC
jgi:tRNA threonylcarbamoyladenosine biosynthesis protein TsaE